MSGFADWPNRPEPDKMLPFEWVYWRCVDLGDLKLANAVEWLIGDRAFALDSARWQANRRHEVQEQLNRLIAHGDGPRLVS